MTLAALSTQITKQLGLESSPIGVQPVKEAPSGVPTFAGQVPSACALWRVAEKGKFFAAADAHHNCPIGAHVLGLPITGSVGKMLGDLIVHMAGAAYLDPVEVAGIPRLAGGPSGFVYGPLASFDAPPALALVWVGMRQLMILEEALGEVAWTRARAQVMGRPACGALASAANDGRPAASVGCAGMRTFTEVSDDLGLVAIPGALLATLGAKLQVTVDANAKMVQFYEGRRAGFPAISSQSP